MSTRSQIAANRFNPKIPATPRSADRQSCLPSQLPQIQPLCPIAGHRVGPPPEAKANFAQPQSSQQKIGFVPVRSFISLYPAPPGMPQPLPPASEHPTYRCWHSRGDCQRNPGKPQTSNPSPSPLFPVGQASSPVTAQRPGSQGSSSHPQPSSSKRSGAPPRPTIR
jgi:hypothetical protein